MDLNLKLKIWRQTNNKSGGHFETYNVVANEHMSFLEMLDVLNEDLVNKREQPVAFEHDCREGICGTCSLTINGQPHGPNAGTTACQLHMRFFKDGETITVEPFRAGAFPVVKDLVVDRSALDRVIHAGGFVSVNAGQAQDGNAIPIEKERASQSFESAACIGCGACVAACPNGSAMLFTSAKVRHLGLLPQGEVEEEQRVQNMVAQMDKEGFGMCSNIGACEAECPKEIKLYNIAYMNRAYFKAAFTGEE